MFALLDSRTRPRRCRLVFITPLVAWCMVATPGAAETSAAGTRFCAQPAGTAAAWTQSCAQPAGTAAAWPQPCDQTTDVAVAAGDRIRVLDAAGRETPVHAPAGLRPAEEPRLGQSRIQGSPYGPFGGHMQCFVESPDGQDVYASTFGAGVFRSSDGGATWTPAWDGVLDTDVRSLAVDPTNPAVVWCGTFWRGVFRSTDRGAT